MQKNILIMGGSGFIGSALAESLVAEGWQIRILTRDLAALQGCCSFPCRIFAWENGEIPSAALKDITAVVNLVGQPVADHAWTASYKAKILNSRIKAVKALKRALLREKIKPEVIVQASAIGYYGFAQNTEIDESSAAGSGFLSETCQLWEAEAQELAAFSRLCIARIGLVLGWGGGAFPQLHDVYCAGVGAVLGKGTQEMNWIHLFDVVNFFKQALTQENYSGIFNLVAPGKCTNKEFHSELSKYTASFTAMKAPKIALKLMLGQRAALLLEGARVKPQRVLDAGFTFRFSNMTDCLKDLFAQAIDAKAHVLEFRQWVAVSKEKTWEFIAAAENLEKITPPWLRFKVLRRSTAPLNQGATIDYALRLHGLPLQWQSLISQWQPPSLFADKQLVGPYKSWHHRHYFKDLAQGVLIIDRVEYKLPVFPIGEVALPFIKRDLLKIFKFRQKKMAELLIAPDR